jgi:hypothetical protein
LRKTSGRSVQYFTEAVLIELARNLLPEVKEFIYVTAK